MKTNKFRVWDKHLKKFHKNAKIKANFNSTFSIRKDDNYNDLKGDFEKNFVFQQYIGLNDTKGKNIYEGDLLEFYYTYKGTRFVGKVEYETEFACYIVVVDKAFVTFSDLADHTTSFKVVGNIFENPKRLK